MGSFPGKLIGVMLAFILMIIAPMVNVVLTQNIRIERTTWNYLKNFTDTASDKGMLTKNDYTEFIAKLGATTVDYEVYISVQHKLILPNGTDQYKTKFVSSGLWKSSTGGVMGDFYMEAGDSLQVVLKPISATPASGILRSVLNLNVSKKEYTYASSARNDGR